QPAARRLVRQLQAEGAHRGRGADRPGDRSAARVPWKVAIDRLLVLENPDAKVLELAGSDMTPYLRAHERDIQDIAVITRTPRHYLFQEGQSPSGDAIKSAETGLVATVRDKQRYMAEALAEAIRLA